MAQKRTRLQNVSPLANVSLHTFFIFVSLMVVIPFILLITVSLSDDKSVMQEGFKFIPSKWSFDAYKFLFSNSRMVLDAYKVTIGTTVVGVILHLLVASMYAFGISKKDMPMQKFFTFFLFFTMLFNGGMVASYIINTQFLGLKNTYAALVLPLIMNAWHILILRTFFTTSIPSALEDACRIDGAGDIRFFFHVVLPLSKPVLATIALFQTLAHWNDWFLSLLYITKDTMYTLQFVMLQTMRQMEAMRRLLQVGANADILAILRNIPKETTRFAMVIVAIGPIILVYPYFQKYFVKGVTVGSIKG